MSNVAEYIQDLFKVREAELKFLICPDWQSGNYDLSPKVHNGQCDGLYDFASGTWITQSDPTKRALWKKDGTWNNKWYLKFDGVNDEYYNALLSPLSNDINGNAFLIFRPITDNRYIYFTLHNYCRTSSASIQIVNNNNVGKGFTVNYSMNRYSSIYYHRLNTTIIENRNELTLNFTKPAVSTLSATGISIGSNSSNAGTSFANMELCLLGLYESTNPFPFKTIQGLMNFGKIEYGAGKKY